MGISERKQRELQEFKNAVLSTSYAMIQESGFEDFSMRKLASRLEYSVSKLYQAFDNKDAIIFLLCEDLCKKLHTKLKNVPQFKNREKYLSSLALSQVEFYAEEPKSSVLINYTCFDSNKQPPTSFSEAMKIYSQAIKDLDYQNLKSEKELDSALETLHLILGGIGQFGHEDPKKSRSRMEKVMGTSVKTLLRGWKGAENENTVLK